MFFDTKVMAFQAEKTMGKCSKPPSLLFSEATTEGEKKARKCSK